MKRGHYPKRQVYAPGSVFFDYVLESAASPGLGNTGKIYTKWNCRCICGSLFTTTTKQIKRGIRKSCGCRSRSNRFKRYSAPLEVVILRRFGSYRTKAEARGRKFDISLAQATELFMANCFYCGALPAEVGLSYLTEAERKRWAAPAPVKLNGIDRIDSTRGYELDNIVACCETCNRAKGQLTQQKFLSWAARLGAHQSANRP